MKDEDSTTTEATAQLLPQNIKKLMAFRYHRSQIEALSLFQEFEKISARS